MVINLAMVVGQTLFVKLLSRFSYVTKFLSALFPLVLLMVAFPIMTEFPSDQVAWILSIIGCALIGILNYFIMFRNWYGITKFFYDCDSWDSRP
jgi:drug/metabolite transporter (DMT)-like permease